MNAKCSTCGADIRYVGPYWLHIRKTLPGHIAMPDEATVVVNDDRKPLDPLSDVIEDANVPD